MITSAGYPTIARRRNRTNGFTLIEIIIVLLVGSVLTAAAIPQIKQALYNYRLRSAVAMVTWAIQSTRFQSLMQGYPFQVVFNKDTLTYQIQSLPSGVTYGNVGTAVPLSGSTVTLDQNMTVQVKPNGSLAITVGTAPLAVGYQGTTKQVTVTSYGNVLVQ